MKKLRNTLALLLVMAMVLALFAGCSDNGETTGAINNGGNGTTTPSSSVDDTPNDPDDYKWDTKDDDLLGITDDAIYVGNTAAVTGAYAIIGEPFNIGINAALAAYNAGGGYKGKSVILQTYDDKGDTTQSVSYLEKLVYDDEVFAVVGHFGSYAIDATLDILIDEGVPMVYAAAGNNTLYNADDAIFPVQPLNQAEGQVLILRAFATVANGGLGATKVGVLSTNDEASQSMLKGIKEEAESYNLTSIVYQNVTGSDFSAAINAFNNDGVDLVLITCTGSSFLSALKAMINAKLYVPVLTTYNNASATALNTEDGTNLSSEYTEIFQLNEEGSYNIPIYAQAWLDTSSEDYIFDAEGTTSLGAAWKYLYENVYYMTYAGVSGFTEEYWEAAQAIYDYCVSQGNSDAFTLSYDAYALAGYIAGNLFCQGLAALEDGGYALTRNNYIQVMETQVWNIPMGDTISYGNGVRAGVQSFGLIAFYADTTYAEYGLTPAKTKTVSSLISIEDLRASLAG